MDIHEFELRYRSYQWLNTKYQLWRSDDILLGYVQKNQQKGQLTRALTETSVEELRDLTRDTYTPMKHDLLTMTHWQILTWSISLADYIERIEYELKVVHEMGYNTYFLVVQDYIVWARKNWVTVWPWRWSCAGSLVCFLITITDLDPMMFDLLFERFLNPARISMPDIDTDFEDTSRDQVIEYIRKQYGYDKVAHIGTYLTMAAKAAFKDVARVFGVSFMQSNQFAGLITESSLQKSIDTNEELRKSLEQDDRFAKIMNIALQLEGSVRGTGVHACGMIIAPDAVTTYAPIQHPPLTGAKSERDTSRVVAQYEWYNVEDLWLLKMDILWLRNLTIIKQTIRIICKKAQAEWKIINPLFQEFNTTLMFHPPLDDTLTFEKVFATWDTGWVFQFESDGMRSWLKKLKPNVFDDLVAMVALYRPWPMEFIPNYIRRKHGEDQVIYGDEDLFHQVLRSYGKQELEYQQWLLGEDLWRIMNPTYGVAVYQEQLMRLVQSMAGFSMAEADMLRRWVGKKIKEVVEKIKVDFIEKSASFRWYKPEVSSWIYEKMVMPAADYSFNKSHAACYAYISYQTAYLKAHFPVEFHAALLRSVEQDTDKLAHFVDELSLRGIQVQWPDVNTSFEHVAAIGDIVKLWFASIKGIGSEIAGFLQREHQSWWIYTSLENFLTRCASVLNKKSLESLVKSGAMDVFADRMTLYHNTAYMLDRIKATESTAQQGGWLFDFAPVEKSWNAVQLIPYDGLDKETIVMELEREQYKTYITHHPLDKVRTFARWSYSTIQQIQSQWYQWSFKIFACVKAFNKGMKKWFFLTVEDISGTLEFFILLSLDLNIGDLVTIEWRVGTNPRIQEMIVHDRTVLLSKISGWSSLQAIRKERFAAQQTEKETVQKYTILEGI
jgi:DNA polymerase-3 subunit alpha